MKTPARRYGSFFLSLALLWFFCFSLIPWAFENFAMLRQIGTFIEEEDISTGEFFYTDVESVSRADRNATNTILYLPRGPQQTKTTEKNVTNPDEKNATNQDN